MSDTMTSSSLQQAWELAQPKLVAIRNSLNFQGSPTPRIIRVGQLDSELLDQELVQVLKEPLNKAISLIDASLKTRLEPELTLLIQLSLYKFSIWNLGASYGAKLQDLRYFVRPSLGQSLSPSGIPHRTLLVHGTLTVLIPYIHARLRTHALSNAWPDAHTSDRRRKAWGVLTTLESSYTLLGLLSFIIFLWDGRYRTIADRILNMRLAPLHRLVKRDVSYEFMNRQMVWHAFTEFLLFLLPLIPASSIRRNLTRLTTSITLTSISSHIPTPLHSILGVPREELHEPLQDRKKKHGKYWSLPLDQCAICAEAASFTLYGSDTRNTFASASPPASSTSTSALSQPYSPPTGTEAPACPLYIPYRASCGDVYCYHCLVECMLSAADEGEVWECLRCGEKVRSADRFVISTEIEHE